MSDAELLNDVAEYLGVVANAHFEQWLKAQGYADTAEAYTRAVALVWNLKEQIENGEFATVLLDDDLSPRRAP